MKDREKTAEILKRLQIMNAGFMADNFIKIPEFRLGSFRMTVQELMDQIDELIEENSKLFENCKSIVHEKNKMYNLICKIKEYLEKKDDKDAIFLLKEINRNLFRE